MKYLLVVAVMLVGCSPNIVKPKWPDAPSVIKSECSPLQEIKNETTKLSEVLNVVVDNYSLYHECAIKVQGWAEWYDKQRKIHEAIK